MSPKFKKTISFDEEHQEILAHVAKEEERTESAVLRRAIKLYAEASK